MNVFQNLPATIDERGAAIIVSAIEESVPEEVHVNKESAETVSQEEPIEIETTEQSLTPQIVAIDEV